MTGQPGITPETLNFEWGDAYLICYARDQWAALRRDTRQFLTAATLTSLKTLIEADYHARPVPRDYDPPGTADYLNLPDEDEEGDEDEAPGPDRDRLEQLMGLRQLFPQWAISYSPFSRTWTARNDDATIRQNTAALLCFALIEHKERRARPDGPPWPGTPAS